MALNIKDEKTHELVKELAELKGVSQNAAVRELVETELRRMRRTALTEKWLEIIKETGPMFGDDFSSDKIDELLYDELGLPK